MSDQKQPEDLTDDDLDVVQGGGAGARQPGKKDGIIWMDAGEGSGVKAKDPKGIATEAGDGSI